MNRRTITGLQRFGVGCTAAVVIPIAKLWQNGLDLTTINWLTVLGAVIPVILMAAGVGAYAVFVKWGETDMKKLFEVCLLLPGLFVSFAGGKALTEAKAGEKEIVCTPINDFKAGLKAAVDSLTNGATDRWMILSKEPHSSFEYIKIENCIYWVIQRVKTKPATGIVFDSFTCKIIETTAKK